MKTIAIIGLGARGAMVYGDYCHNHKEQAKIVAIADIDQEKVKKYQKKYMIDDSNCFSSGEELLNQGKIADVLFIASPDRCHYLQTIKATELGYDILLEKPIAVELEHLLEIQKLSEEKQNRIVVCHVMRYAPFYSQIKNLIDDNKIGDIIQMNQTENVGYWHFAHSFVRGNWRNTELSSPSILQKTCHDFDQMTWFINQESVSVSSFGNLYHFSEQNAPKGASNRCLDNCKAKDNCPYDVEKIYIENSESYQDKNVWPFAVLTTDVTKANLYDALKTGPYGRCVYHSDNDVVDHQVVNIRYTNNVCANLTMIAHSGATYRELHIYGTKGEIKANDLDNIIELRVFDGRFESKKQLIDIVDNSNEPSGHGGGDNGLMKEFFEYIETGKMSKNLTSIERSIESHIMALKAELSRTQDGKVVLIRS